MSIDAVRWALNAKIGQTRKLVLVTIAESHNAKTGDCFPSQKYIAEVIGQKERATRYHLAELEADGFITRKHRYDQRGHRTSDGYILNLKATEPTGKVVPVDYRQADAASEPSLPANSCRLPANLASPTGNYLPVDIDEPESSTGRLVPEERAPAAPEPQIIDDGVVDFSFKLWSEGTTILESLGLDEDKAKRMIGRWLKVTGNQHERVLAAIQYASEQRTRDPISLITASLKVATPLAGSPRRDPVLEGAKRVYDRMFGQSDTVARPAA